MTLLELRGISVRFRQYGAQGRELAAVEGVDLTIGEHEMLGLVGESGCGKTTLGRAILRLVPLAAGELRWRGQRFDGLSQRAFRPLRRELQYVFQDPNACLDPRMTLRESVAEPLRALDPGTDASARAARVQARLDEVGIGADLAALKRQKLEPIPGTVPTLRGVAKPGCRFAPRCTLAKPMHFDNTPPLKEVRPGHKVACFLY